MQIDEILLYKQIGQQVKAQRVKLGYSQAWLAERVGLLRTSITNIESGRQKLPLHSLYAICMALGVEPSEILPAASEVASQEREEVVIDDQTRKRVPPETARFIRALVNESRSTS